WLSEVSVNVSAQCLERRDVDDSGLLRQRAVQAFPQQLVDGDEKRREGFPRAGRGRDQRVAARADGFPATALRGGRLSQSIAEPAGNGGVKVVQRHRWNIPLELSHSRKIGTAIQPWALPSTRVRRRRMARRAPRKVAAPTQRSPSRKLPL